jgi:SulP family sulfate permease
MSLKKRLFSNVSGDVLGGITTAVVALPLALGFGVAAGFHRLDFGTLPVNGAFCGLVGAIIVGALAALFGGTPAQISGPTGPITVVVAAFIGGFTGDPRWVFATFALAGLVQLACGLLGLGAYVNYIPYPVVSGFMSGIGVIIILLQIPVVFGVTYTGGALGALKGAPAFVAQANPYAVIFALGTMAVIYLTPHFTKKVPGPLVALILMTGVELVEHFPVPVIGAIPSGRPQLMIPDAMDLGMLWLVLPTAVMMAALSSIDSLLTSVVHDQVTKTRHDSNRELVGQGIGNFFAGLFGGLPSAGATMRTVVNVRSGGRGPLSGVVHSLFLLAVVLVLRPYAEQIPLAVLAGILISVGVGIIDYRGLKHLKNVPRGDAAVLLTVLTLTVFKDLILAIGVGMVMACVILMKRLADMRPATYGPLMDVIPNHPWMPEVDVHEEAAKEMVFVELGDLLFFGNTGPLQRSLGSLTDATAIVLSLRSTRYLDQSGAYALAEVIEELRAGGTRIFLTDVSPENQALLEKLDIVGEVLPPEKVHATASEGVEAAARKIMETKRAA